MPRPRRVSSDLPALTHTATEPDANPAAVTLVTDDGFLLGGSRWLATGESRGVVLIAPATGAPHRFYLPFAEFLASRGFDTLTWDWRGIGDSRHEGSLRDPRLTMRAWGERDLAAAIAWGERRRPEGPIHLVGHSFGGQALGLAPNAGSVTSAVLIAAQHGWVGHWPRGERWKLALLWRLGMPLASRVLGRFPSAWLGLGEDLPGGVAREWARWNRRPQHLGTWSGHAALQIPMLALSFTDDTFAPRAAVEALLRAYPTARVEHEHLAPEGLGHFGFFREGCAPDHWNRVAEFLLAPTAAAYIRPRGHETAPTDLR